MAKSQALSVTAQVFFQFLAALIFASLLRAEIQSFPVDDIKTLKVVGFRGHLRIVGDVKTSVLRIQGLAESPQVHVNKNEGILTIAVEPPKSKDDINSTVSTDLVLSSTSIPLEISWKEGAIEVEKWKKTVSISTMDSKIDLREIEANVSVHQFGGTFAAQKIKGNLSGDSFNTDSKITMFEGNVELEDHAGPVLITHHKGNIVLKSFNGSVTIDKVEGSVEVRNSKGITKLSGIKGRINCKTEQGVVSAKPIIPVNIRVVAQDGNVEISVPHGSGAHMNLGSEEGKVSAPGNLKTLQLNNLKIFEGTLGGGETGSIFVRSTTGRITIKE